jgi:hypothetical protein
MSEHNHDHDVRQEADHVDTSKVVVIGIAALIAFAVGIGWAVAIQRGQTGTIRNDTAPRPKAAGRTEIGMVYQPLFDRGKGIAEDRASPQRARLHSYGFVGKDKQVAHIPVERAIQLVIERGKL